MKKQLLATTALVAGGLIAGSAMAADPIKLQLGGYAQTGVTIRAQDNISVSAAGGGQPAGDDRTLTGVTTDLGRTDVAWEAEVFFVGETTLDNGIKVGVNIQLEAYTSNDQIDEHYVYITGGFGRLVLGAENSAPYIMHYAAPSPTGNAFGSESPNHVPFRAPGNQAIANVNTPLSLTSDANKLTYYTPRFAPGFQFGISYTPDDDAFGGVQTVFGNNCRGGCAFDAGNGISDNDRLGSVTGAHHHFVEAAFNFVRSINGVDLAFDVGYGTGFIEKQTRGTLGNGATTDRERQQRHEVQAGFNLGVAGFTFGMGAHYDNQGVQGPNDRWDITAGIMYGAGPWLVGINAGYANVQDGRRVSGGQYVRRSNDSLIYGALEGVYILGPGIRIFSALNFAKWEGNGTVNEEADGIAWTSGMLLNF